ncbi:MAG: tyrosine-type recombinase/integrase [Syntrophales bacterium]
MPYFDQKRKKWKGVVKSGKKRFTHRFQTKTEAKTWEVEKWKELENPKPEEQEEKETGTDLLTASNEYLDFCERRFSSITYSEKKKLCKSILRKWGNVDVKDITPTMVLKHLEARAREVSNNTWNRDRKNLLAMFNWFRKIKGITHNPVVNVDRLPEERRPEYIPPAEDVDKVMMACGGQDRVMLQCFYFTFARRSEIFNWTWEDINFEKQWYRLWTRKRLHSDRQADYFPLPEDSELYRALKWQWEHRNINSPYVFTDSDTGKKYIHRSKFMERLCKKAGVKPFGFKALRKFGPSVLNDIHRVSIKKLQRLLRHRTQTTTEIYLKKIDDDLSVGLRLLEKRTPTGTPTRKWGLR